MRCFKIFFKHTWHPQQMDNPGRLGSPSKQCPTASQNINETEFGELRTESPSSPQTEITLAGTTGVSCYNGACKITSGKIRAEHRLESPWHHLKTLFLIFMIVALIVWIIVYVLLSQYEIV